MPDMYGNPTEAELRGQAYQQTQGYDPALAGARAQPAGAQPIAGVTPGYLNGHVFAGTGGQPMSDAAYALLSNNGTQPIATSADVSGNGGVGGSLHNAGTFELDHIGNIGEGLVDQPSRLVFGFDPLGQKAANAVDGSNNDPLVNQMGGATGQQIRDYEAEHGTNSAGGAQGLHNAAAGTAGIIAAGQLAQSGLFGGQGAAPTTAPPATEGSAFGGLGAGSSGAPASGSAFGGLGAVSDAALPEIVVTGTIPAGMTAGEVAALGAGGLGAGAALSNGGSGATQTAHTTSNNGWSNTSDPQAAFQNTASSNAQSLAEQGGIKGGSGMGSATEGGGGSSMGWQDYAKEAMNLMGGMGGGGQQQRPALYEGRSAELERERQRKEAEDDERRRRYAAALQQTTYSPAAV